MRFVRKQTVAVVLHPLFNILRSQKINITSKILSFNRVAGQLRTNSCVNKIEALN
jgi:hypothetical protein